MGWLDEMASWFEKERRKAGKKFLCDLNKRLPDAAAKINAKIDEDENIEESYNVAIYQVLPYPPNTKDVKDFFIQRN